MSKRLAIELLHKYSNPPTHTIQEPDEDGVSESSILSLIGLAARKSVDNTFGKLTRGGSKMLSDLHSADTDIEVVGASC